MMSVSSLLDTEIQQYLVIGAVNSAIPFAHLFQVALLNT